jgi:hypothetical protein
MKDAFICTRISEYVYIYICMVIYTYIYICCMCHACVPLRSSRTEQRGWRAQLKWGEPAELMASISPEPAELIASEVLERSCLHAYMCYSSGMWTEAFPLYMYVHTHIYIYIYIHIYIYL